MFPLFDGLKLNYIYQNFVIFYGENMLKILLITNDTYGDGEDSFLLQWLQRDFLVNLYDISQPLPLNLTSFDLFLFRNAWPGRIYYRKIQKIVQIASENNIIIYNSLEQKSLQFPQKEYLYYLCELCPYVIPTYKNLADFPENVPILIKPKNGGSSYGVQIFSNKQLIPQNLKLDNYILQEFLELKKEVSFYFIDKKFIYALQTKQAGMNYRWDLQEFTPTDVMLNLAQYFVNWNDMKYGIDRIDFGLTYDDKLLLMEIESDRSYLSLEELSSQTLTRFLDEFKKSLLLAYSHSRLII